MSPRQILITRHEDLVAFNIPEGGLRENIVIAGIRDDEFKPGALLQIGSVEIRLSFFCEPCKRINQYVNPADIIKRRGILGIVLTEGSLEMNMSVKIQPNVFEPMSDLPYNRFNTFISKIPVGKVVTYKTVILGIGVAESYIRAIPTYIRKSETKLPLHRIVDSEGALIPQYITNQKKLLLSEDVKLIETLELFNETNKCLVALDQHLWEGASIFIN
jgi:alkylated DNA nucleotide flippase Atl1